MLHESHAPAAVIVPGVVIAPGAVALETQHGWSRRPKMTRDPAFARAHLPALLETHHAPAEMPK